MISTVHDLIERPVSFRYGYNMTCGQCGGITPLTANTYYREQSHSARIKCVHRRADIHYGQGPMALRDAADPVLDDQLALGTAWYHTSTDPLWPTRGRTMTATEFAAVRQGAWDDVSAERVRVRSENQALHLGTYEAAIESMLRKMEDQDMAAQQFWLYRVALAATLQSNPATAMRPSR